MDLILYLNDLITDWNTERKCGFCWTFTAPLTEAMLNEYQHREGSECCVLVAVTNYNIETRRTYNRVTSFEEFKTLVHDFDLSFLVTDNIGRNVYDEIKHHDISESKWAKILRPIDVCVGSKDIFAFCERLGYNVSVDLWRGSIKLNYLDNNYTGWTYHVRLTEIIQ